MQSGLLDDLPPDHGFLRIDATCGINMLESVRIAKRSACVMLAVLLVCARGAPAEDLSLSGWRMWPDTNTAWKSDTLYLPSQVVLSNLPVNPPTGGWAALNSSLGIPVTLPSSVEQYYWAAFRGGVLDANYQGVSWWWRTFTAPTLQAGQRLIIQFRAARLRAEVYCNQRLCGYNLINEVPFEADVTDAMVQGATTNQLAVRITSPGGNLDWVDWGSISWGAGEVPLSRGVCGLDSNIILQVRDNVCVSDFAVLNRPNPREVWLVGAVTNMSSTIYNGPLSLDIQDSNSIALWQATNIVSVPSGGQIGFSNVVVLSSASLWDLTNPVLYKADAAIPGNGASGMSVNFGFRWFTPEGIGSNALLRLNGRRIVLRSAISWGWWAPDGLFPNDAMAQKEVLAAQALGLNCIQFHRNLGHPNVLDQQDRLGLLRYQEPGNGEAIFGANFSTATVVPTDLSGNGGQPVTFDQQYEVEKILRMVRRDRSHPSLVVYCIQNEVNPALTNAYIWWLFHRIHEIDPSRTVVLHSGIGANNEVLMMPYSTNFLYENGSGYSGWSDQHTVGGPGNYQDNLYVNANNYSHRSDNSAEIAMWGEMLGVGMPDDHEAIVEWYQTNGLTATGYDLQLHQQVLRAYNSFLDNWGFRSSFPTASSLFHEIGKKSYFFWQKLVENGRICDNNDYLVISGWESTLGENHSGLVDAHRNFRTDPSILKKAMNPEVLVLRPKRFVLKPGETANVDVHLINETGRVGAQSLTVTAFNPDGSVLLSRQQAVTATGGDVFGQVLATNLTFVPRTNGTVRIDGVLQPNGGSGDVLTNEVELLVVDPAAGSPVLSRVMVFESNNQIAPTLGSVFGVTPLSSDQLTNSLDVIIIGAGGTSTWSHQSYNVGDAISNTSDPGLFQNQMYGKTGTVGAWSGFAPGNITVQLYFAETYWSATNMRVFDVAINGATVLTNLDIFQQAGGRDIALVKTFTVNSTNGAITLSFPRVAADNAQIAAFKITDASNNVTAVVFSTSSFTDHNGLVWQPLAAALGSMLPLTDAQWQTSLNQVYSNGVRLIAWPNGVNEATTFANKLAASNIVSVVNWNGNNGFLGQANAPWLGSWYFARQHWLLDGLPVNSVLGWQYQVPHLGTDVGALLIDSTPTCPMDVMIGYGRDHEAHVGVGCAVIQYGKGLIILPSLPGLRDALVATGAEITQPVAQRLLGNSLRAMPASSPQPPTDVKAINGNGRVMINWNPAFGGTAYNVKRSNVSGGAYTLISSNLAAWNWTDAGLANGSNYYYVVSAVNGMGESSNSVEVVGLPQIWPGMDIGAVSASGSTSQNGDVITVIGSGSDIYGTADAFQFAPQIVSGDCDIRALVTAVGNTHVWAKAGVMIRESLDPSARNMAMVITPGNGAEIQYRASPAGSTAFATQTGPTAPYWARLIRTGNNFAGYCSADGTNWAQVGSTQVITMSSNTYVGLAVTSHNDGSLCTATFTKVSLVALPCPWLTADVGNTGATGSAIGVNEAFTVLGAGTDISNSADAFRYVYVNGNGDCDVMAQVTTLGNTDPWAKAGVMIRETIAPGAPNAALLVTPGNGVIFQCRTNAGGLASVLGSCPILPPAWVRLIRSGNFLAAYVSTNGTNWMQVGAMQNFTMATTVCLGLPVTSHNSAGLTTATFTNVATASGVNNTNIALLSPAGLRVAISSASAATIQWFNAVNTVGASLYSTPSLSPPVVWTLVGNVPIFSAGQWTVTVPIATNNSTFYRLQR
jgi:hypothetical protein